MSTRATIAVRNNDGGYKSIYLHFDGYPRHAGKALRLHYADRQAAASLISGGDIRSTDPDTGATERYRDIEGVDAMPEQTSSYEEIAAIARRRWSQYLYVFDDERWTCVEL